MFSCDDYDQDVFVDRPAALAKMRAWADTAAVERRVMPLVAPPGGGKSWILKNLEQGWNSAGDRFVVYMDVPSLVDLDKNGSALIKMDGLEKWLQEVEAAAAQRYSIQSISRVPQLQAILSEFARLICDCNPVKDPIILVDGYDELSEAQAEVFSSQILKPLHERDCIRLIIAHRPECNVKGDSLRTNQHDPKLFLHELDPLSPKFALDQFKRLFQKARPRQTPPELSAWMTELKHYKWNHPLANCFFFKLGMNSSWAKLTGQDLKDGCKRIIERPDNTGRLRFPLHDDGFKMLHRIANELPDQWSQDPFQETLNIPNMNIDATYQALYKVGAIIISPDIPPFYQICDGLRDLLREFELP
ncbi:MAG: hypothetical protein HFACDABA_01680 [Anaerolineales bacterium]|nr:hypothetical protein [Anaerolineales bacterium]